MRAASESANVVHQQQQQQQQHAHQQQQHQQHQHQQQQQAPSSAEEIALKKNTDCVYFLASPLTCKKGNDCEFRHSESTRINPRDCWFWLSGSCLNRDCPFRHPPLDVRAPAAAAAPVPAPAAAAVNNTKGRTPCYYYHQGYCAKGDRCSFMHGASAPPPAQQQHQAVPIPQPSTAPIPDTTVVKEVVVQALPKSEGTPVKAVTTKPVKSTIDVQLQAAHEVTRSTEAVAPASKLQGASRNGLVLETEARSSEPMDDVEDDSPTAGGLESGGRDPDDRWEESSPGFDVLVDDGTDELHYNAEGEYQVNDSGRHFEQDVDGYEFPEFPQGGVAEYEPREPFERPVFERFEQARFEGGIYEFERSNDGFDHIDYDRPRYEQSTRSGQDMYRRMDSSYNGRSEHLTIRDRLSFNNSLERRPYLDNGDLRNLLEKRRRVESVDRYRGEAIYRDIHDGYRHQDDYDRFQERRRQQGHLQQGRPNGRRSRERSYMADGELSQQRPRIYHERRNSRDASVPTTPRQQSFRKAEAMGSESSDFAPPKSLAQIRAEKRKFREDDEEEPAADSLKRCSNYAPRDVKYSRDGENFSGPKPLSEILKEKRKAGNDTNHHHHVLEDDGGLQQQHSAARQASSNGVSTGSFSDQLLHLVDTNTNNNSTAAAAAAAEEELSDEEDDDFVKKLGGYFS